jgi:outer membrane lipoprotein SlyB
MLVQSSSCALCGTVESIRTVELRDEAGAATAAAGGPARYAYRVTVRMDDGSFRTVSLSSPPTLAVGDKVRVVEGRLVRT